MEIRVRWQYKVSCKMTHKIRLIGSFCIVNSISWCLSTKRVADKTENVCRKEYKNIDWYRFNFISLVVNCFTLSPTAV